MEGYILYLFSLSFVHSLSLVLRFSNLLPGNGLSTETDLVASVKCIVTKDSKIISRQGPQTEIE